MAAAGRADTRTACPVDGVDQPSTAGPTAAPPSSTGTKIWHVPPCGVCVARDWGVALLTRIKLYSWSQACMARPRVRYVPYTLVCYAPGTHA